MGAFPAARSLGPRLVAKSPPAVEWTDYPRLVPGTYAAYCRAARWYRDPVYKRWVCLLRFDVLAPDRSTSLGSVPLWLNGGSGAAPRASRRGRYLELWVQANGAPPIRRDKLSPAVFTKRIARVKIGDTKGPVPYSVIREIVAFETGGKPC